MENNNLETAVSKKKRFPVWAIIAAAVIVVAGVVGAVSVASTNSTKKKVAQNLELARKYVSELNYEQAVIAYEAIIKIDPKNVDAYIGLADIYVAIGDTKKAEETLEEAAKNVDKSDLEKVEKKIQEVKKEIEEKAQNELKPTEDVIPDNDRAEVPADNNAGNDANAATDTTGPDVVELQTQEVTFAIDEHVRLVEEDGSTVIANGKTGQYSEGDVIRFKVAGEDEGYTYEVSLPGSDVTGATLTETGEGAGKTYAVSVGKGNLVIMVSAVLNNAGNVSDDNNTAVDDTTAGQETQTADNDNNTEVTVPVTEPVEEDDAPETHLVSFKIADNVSVSDADEDEDDDEYFLDGGMGEYDEGELIRLLVEPDQGFICNVALQGAGAGSAKMTDKAAGEGRIYEITVGKGDLTVVVTSSIDPNTGALIDFEDVIFERAVREAAGWNSGDDIWAKDAEAVTELTLDESELTNIGDLKYFKNLESLDLGGTSVKDISVLSGLTKLKELYLNETKVSDISALAKLTNLKELDLSDTSVSNVSALSGLTKLEVLSLESTQVSNISSLSGLTNLKELSLKDTEVSDISALKNCTNMTDLDLWGTEVSSISAVSGMTKLKELKLWGTDVSDVSPLKNLKKLTYLDLSGTDVSDVSPLAGLTQLEYLNLTNTDVDEDTDELDNLENTEIVWE